MTVKQIASIFFILLFLLQVHIAFAQLNREAAQALIRRIIPAHASQFAIESLNKSGDQDVFEIEMLNDKIVLRGNNGVSIASALYY